MKPSRMTLLHALFAAILLPIIAQPQLLRADPLSPLNNRDLNQVTWEERVQLGEGKTQLTQSIPDFPYHKYAELIGLKGIFVDDP